MKHKLILCLALVLSGFLFQRAFGSVDEVQLNQKDTIHSQCSVKVEPTADGIHFSCSIRKTENVSYEGSLQIYDRTNLIATRPVKKTIDAKFVRCEFTVGKGYLDNSRFSLIEIAVGRDGKERPSGIQYWFYLHDFANVK